MYRASGPSINLVHGTGAGAQSAHPRAKLLTQYIYDCVYKVYSAPPSSAAATLEVDGELSLNEGYGIAQLAGPMGVVASKVALPEHI